MTSNKVDKLHSDGAYQSPDNRRLVADGENGFEFVANGIQGKPARFDFNRREDGTLEVTDKNTAEVLDATKVKEGKWKIPVTDKNGKKTYRYFDDEADKRCDGRWIPSRGRNARNATTSRQASFNTASTPGTTKRATEISSSTRSRQ